MKPKNIKMPLVSCHEPSRKQRGFTLLLTTAIALGISASVAIGLVILQQRANNKNTLSTQQTLQWADDALTGFAALHGRLPCPAATPNAKESCDQSAAKGWLPTASLGASHSRIDHKSLPRLRYTVYRNHSHNQAFNGRDTRDLDLTQTHIPPPPPAMEEPDFEWCWDRMSKVTGDAPSKFPPPPPPGWSGPRAPAYSRYYICGGKALEDMVPGIGSQIIVLSYGTTTAPTVVTVIYKNNYPEPVRVEPDRPFSAVIDELRGHSPVSTPDPNAGVDIKALDKFMPRKASFNPLDPRKDDVYDIAQSDMLDLCDKLQRVSPLHLPGKQADVWSLSPHPKQNSPTYAYVRTEGQADLKNVAYAVALSSPVGESDLNADSNRPGFEIPAPTLNARPTDSVRATSFQQLAHSLGCPQLLSSLDTLATFVESTMGVEASRESMKTEWRKHHWKYKTMYANRAWRLAASTITTGLSIYDLVETTPDALAETLKCFSSILSLTPDVQACYRSGWLWKAVYEYVRGSTLDAFGYALQIGQFVTYKELFDAYKNLPYAAGVPEATRGDTIDYGTEGCDRLDNMEEIIASTTDNYRESQSRTNAASTHYSNAVDHLRKFQFHEGVLENIVFPKLEEYIDKGLLYDEKKLQMEQATNDTIIAQEGGVKIDKNELRASLSEHFQEHNPEELMDFLDENQDEFNSKALTETKVREQHAVANYWEAERAYTRAKQAWDLLIHDLNHNRHTYCSDCLFFSAHIDALRGVEGALRTWKRVKKDEEDAAAMLEQLKHGRDSMVNACNMLAGHTNETPAGLPALPWSNAIDALHKSLKVITSNTLEVKP